LKHEAEKQEGCDNKLDHTDGAVESLPLRLMGHQHELLDFTIE